PCAEGKRPARGHGAVTAARVRGDEGAGSRSGSPKTVGRFRPGRGFGDITAEREREQRVTLHARCSSAAFETAVSKDVSDLRREAPPDLGQRAHVRSERTGRSNPRALVW